MNNDLISRDALKNAIMNDLGLGDEENGSDAEYMSGLQDCYNLIDNAPTVDIRNKGACEDCEYFDRPITSEPCRNCTLAYGSCFKEKEKVKDDRPRGEWIYERPNGKTYSDFVFCSVCHENNKFYKSNFCPNCGADMRGGVE